MSKRALKEVYHSIYQFSGQNKNNMAFASRQSMTERLKTSFGDLHKIGFNMRHIKNIKSRHVEALVAYWKSEGMATGTIKNRMADLRQVCDHFGKGHIMQET